MLSESMQKKTLLTYLTGMTLCFYTLSSIAQKTILKQGLQTKKAKGYSYSIFGKKYAATPLLDTKLKGHVYYLVSGHGGPDPGAMSKMEQGWLCEDEYAYDITLRLARNLLSHGAKVYLVVRDENDGIRDAGYLKPDKDEVVWGKKNIPLGQKERLKQRTDIINHLFKENQAKGYKIQRAIEIHIDSRYTGQKVDLFFYHSKGSKAGQQLATAMQQTVKRKYNEFQKNRGYTGTVSPRDLWMIRETKPPMVYIEVGNITNTFDQKRLLIPNNRQAMANWLALGILEHTQK